MANTVETTLYTDCAIWWHQMVLAARSNCDVVISNDPFSRSIAFDVVGEEVTKNNLIYLSKLRDPIFQSILKVSGVHKAFLDLIMGKVFADEVNSAILQIAESLSSYGQETEARSELTQYLATLASWEGFYDSYTDEKYEAKLAALGWT